MARKRKNVSNNASETARIVVEYNKEKGTTVRVDKAYSEAHATWLLAQAIQIILEQSQEEVADEPVQELSGADGSPEEEEMPTVSE